MELQNANENMFHGFENLVIWLWKILLKEFVATLCFLFFFVGNVGGKAIGPIQARRRGWTGGSRRSSCLSVGGAKVPFLNAMICFLFVNMIQRRSYKLKASNTSLEKTIIYMAVRGIAHDIPQNAPQMPSISGIYLLA